jgi:tetratricopeptide (TPR) repeat protein
VEHQQRPSAWSLETAHRLVGVSASMARSGDANEVPGLTARVLQHLDKAGKLARAESDRHAEAAAAALVGHIQANYRGDIPAALAAYKQAVQLDPNDKGTAEALARLEAAYQMLQARYLASKAK